MKLGPKQLSPSIESILWSEYERHKEEKPLLGVSFLCPECGFVRRICIFIDMIAKTYGQTAHYIGEARAKARTTTTME